MTRSVVRFPCVLYCVHWRVGRGGQRRVHEHAKRRHVGVMTRWLTCWLRSAAAAAAVASASNNSNTQLHVATVTCTSGCSSYQFSQFSFIQKEKVERGEDTQTRSTSAACSCAVFVLFSWHSRCQAGVVGLCSCCTVVASRYSQDHFGDHKLLIRPTVCRKSCNLYKQSFTVINK